MYRKSSILLFQRFILLALYQNTLVNVALFQNFYSLHYPYFRIIPSYFQSHKDILKDCIPHDDYRQVIGHSIHQEFVLLYKAIQFFFRNSFSESFFIKVNF